MANAAARRRGQSRKSARSRRLERQELPKISSRPPVFLVWIFSISNPHAHFQESIRRVATQNTVCSRGPRTFPVLASLCYSMQPDDRNSSSRTEPVPIVLKL
jgi:hypothetical protein